jgi:hypothetical protein
MKNENILLTHIESSGSGNGAKGPVVWDNGMNYDNLGAAQWDNVLLFDAHLADDFHFEDITFVADVHWIGGYFGGDPEEFDWCISFYLDDGTGTAPAGVPYNPSYAGPFCYIWEQITKEEIAPGTYEMSVDLPYGIPFDPCIKYWISIWGVGQYPPQSGWGIHETPIILHQSVFGSTYFSWPFWTDSELVFGFQKDCAFQLTAETIPEPDLDCYPDLVWSEVEPGQEINDVFSATNIGEPGSILDWEIISWPTWGVWTFNPPSGTIPAGSTGTVIVQLTAPSEKTEVFTGQIILKDSNDPDDICIIQVSLTTPRDRGLFFNIFEQIIQRFPLLKTLIGLN